MNCRQFSKIIGEYVDRTLSAEAAENAKIHLSLCEKCAAQARALERTSCLLSSLDREQAPLGFEDRLKARMALRRLASDQLRGWLRDPLRTRWYSVRPAIAGLTLCALVMGSIFMYRMQSPEMDWAYLETCREQHSSFAGANPLADGSAMILRERAIDLGEESL